jgi:hypothetical protein
VFVTVAAVSEDERAWPADLPARGQVLLEFDRVFDDTARARLAVLHLFQDAVDVDALIMMGSLKTDDRVPILASLDRETALGLLDRAAGIGVLTRLGGGYYRIHPALPSFLAELFAIHHGPPESPAAEQAVRAYTSTIGDVGNYCWKQYEAGHQTIIDVLTVEEANLLRALDLARSNGWWNAVMRCMQGLRTLYEHTGRNTEWARLVEELIPDLADPDTGGPLPGRDDHWILLTDYRVGLARAATTRPSSSSTTASVTTRCSMPAPHSSTFRPTAPPPPPRSPPPSSSLPSSKKPRTHQTAEPTPCRRPLRLRTQRRIGAGDTHLSAQSAPGPMPRRGG